MGILPKIFALYEGILLKTFALFQGILLHRIQGCVWSGGCHGSGCPRRQGEVLCFLILSYCYQLMIAVQSQVGQILEILDNGLFPPQP
jgi:hypothetical protein